MVTRSPFLLACATVAVPISSLDAETIIVPDDYEQIVDACVAAVAGDVVMVRPGFYLGPVYVKPGVTVTSEFGPEVTNIEFSGGEGGPVTFLIGNEAAIFERFTVYMNDYGLYGIRSYNPNGIIRDNILVGGPFSGLAGIRLEHGGIIEGNELLLEQFDVVEIGGGSVRFAYNFVYTPCRGGPGFALFDADEGVTSATIEHNTIYSESGTEWTLLDGVQGVFKNNILGVTFIECVGPTSSISIDYNLFYGGSMIEGPDCAAGVGNIFGEVPLFCDLEIEPGERCDLRLQPGSPGADDGEGGVPMGAFGVGCDPIVGVGTAQETVPQRLAVARSPVQGDRFAVILELPERRIVELAVFGVQGQQVQRAQVVASAGRSVHRLLVRQPGVYFARAKTPQWSETVRVTVVE